MRRGSPILVVLFVAALVFSSCSEPQTTAWDGELTIHVNDALPKTISYDGTGVDKYGSANVSHYKVDVYEDDMTGEPVTTTGFVASKSGDANVFTIRNLINRTYVITVGGYIRTGNTGTDSDYHLISEDITSFYADYSAVDPEVTLTLKTLAEGTSAVTISAAMPIDFIDPADHTISGELSWQLLDIENPKTVIDSGKVTLTDVELYEESVGLGQYATDECWSRMKKERRGQHKRERKESNKKDTKESEEIETKQETRIAVSVSVSSILLSGACC